MSSNAPENPKLSPTAHRLGQRLLASTGEIRCRKSPALFELLNAMRTRGIICGHDRGRLTVHGRLDLADNAASP